MGTLVRLGGGLSVLLSAVMLLGASGEQSIVLVSGADFYAAVGQAKTITVTTFILPEAITTALGDACDRGARVSILVSGSSLARSTNDRAEEQLRGHRFAIETGGGGSGGRCALRQSSEPLHMKMALLDGVLYLTDRNFDAEGLFVRDADPADRSVAARALAGSTGSDDHFWTRKGDALKAEAAFIHSARATLFVETESFGGSDCSAGRSESCDNPVYDEIEQRAQAGAQIYLLVASSEFNEDGSRAEQAALGSLLCKYHVHVRLSDTNAKLAIPDRSGAWVGSANMTAPLPNQVDWGMVLPGDAVALSVSQRFQNDWNASRPAFPGLKC